MELGMVIHNEPGCQLCPRPSLDALLETMFSQLLSIEDNDHGYVDFTNATEIVVLINNLGQARVYYSTKSSRLCSQVVFLGIASFPVDSSPAAGLTSFCIAFPPWFRLYAPGLSLNSALPLSKTVE